MAVDKHKIQKERHSALSVLKENEMLTSHMAVHPFCTGSVKDPGNSSMTTEGINHFGWMEERDRLPGK